MSVPATPVLAPRTDTGMHPSDPLPAAGSAAGPAEPVEDQACEDLLSGPGLAGLMTLPGVGEKRALALAETFGTWEQVLAATDSDLDAVLGTKTATDLRNRGLPATAPADDLPADTRVVSIHDTDYPPLLRTIADAPTLLWVTGTLPPPEVALLAVVGTRTPNTYGAAVARRIATDAASRGIPVVSGLANGVDSIAHSACLDAGVPTWAVLGQGLGTLPGSGDRADLAHRILTEGGGLISEVPLHTPVAAHLLTRRNRLQSGLAGAVMIAQTGLATGPKPAGTLHTARYAIAQRRPLAVAAVPHDLTGDPEMAGNAALTCPFGMDPGLLHATDPETAALIRMRVPVADLVVKTPQDLGYLYDRLLGATGVPTTVSR